MKYLPFLIFGCLILLVSVAGCAGTEPAPVATPLPTPVIPATTPVPPPEPMPVPVTAQVIASSQYPDALALKEMFPFGIDTKWKSEVTVYRIWINDTYRWFNPADNAYETRVAPPDKKYLFIFVTIVDRGTERTVIPSQNNIYVEYNGAIISPDPAHALPTQNPDSSPRVIRVAEIEFLKKLLGNSEYVEDYGYSHGLKLGFINPGESNAVDGYIIYEVPEELTPENAYVRIVIPGTTAAIWKLG
jgi:hypothetical protein